MRHCPWRLTLVVLLLVQMLYMRDVLKEQVKLP
jgi:hypothetical protein